MAAVLVVLGGIGLAVLPEIVRRVAVRQLEERTGRSIAIEDVDLNVFTGRLALTRVRLGQRGTPATALAIERLDVAVAPLSLLRSHRRVTEITVVDPAVEVARGADGRFDFADLLELVPPPDPSKPSTGTFALDRLTVRGGRVVARDQAVAPAAEWTFDDLVIEASGLDSRVTAAPGRLAVTMQVNGTPLSLTVESLRVSGPAASGRVTLGPFPLPAAVPYAPAAVPAIPRAGTAAVALTFALERTPDGTPRPTVAGEVTLEGLEVVARHGGEPLLRLPRAVIGLEAVDLAAWTVKVKSIALDGLGVAATRRTDGTIDLLALLTSTPARAGLAASAASAAERPASSEAQPAPPGAGTPALTVAVERIHVAGGTVTVTDEAVTPRTVLTVTDLGATARDVAWPPGSPATFEAGMTLPGGGTLKANGSARLAPVDVEITMRMRGAPIEPYGAYFPFPGRFSGRFNGDSRSRLTVADGVIRATSQGRSSIEKLAVLNPAAARDAIPPVRVERIELSGIDFRWPESARVTEIKVVRPDLRIEREADGTLPLRQLLTPPGPPPAGPVAPSAATAATPAAGAEPAAQQGATGPGSRARAGAPLAIEIGKIVVEEGFARFVDRTLTPAFSETVSRLAVIVDGISSAPGRRATLEAQAIVGGDAALELRGEIAPLGELYVNLAGELRDFRLPAVNPYADNLLAWIVQRGRLAAKVHYRVEQAQLTAMNEIVVADLTVAPSQKTDAVQQKIGLPLGLIVSLIQDRQGRIVANVPISGSLGDPKFDLTETIWTAVRNVVVNVVAAPFRAIGRVFTGDDNRIEKLTVEPVTFAPGSATVTEEMERHLQRVASFLRGAPGVALRLTPVLGARDAEAVRGQELTARLQALQRDQKLADYPAAVAAEFRRRFPDEKTLPPPETQLERLLALEPVPPARLTELAERRLQAVRDPLVAAEGVRPDRLRTSDVPESPVDGPPRVEFAIE